MASIRLLPIFACLFLQANPPLNAQAPQGLFLEAGGAAPNYSLNYTRRIFAARKISGHIRIGGAVWGNGLAAPLGASLLLGSGDHHPELTLTLTPYSEGLHFWRRDDSDLLLDFVLGLGYRYWPSSGSFFAAAGLFPYLRLDPTPAALSEKGAELRFRLGLSVGWYFNSTRPAGSPSRKAPPQSA